MPCSVIPCAPLLRQDLLDPQVQLARFDHILPRRFDHIRGPCNPPLRQRLRSLSIGVPVGRDQPLRRDILDLKPQSLLRLPDKAVAQRRQVGKEMDPAPPFLEPPAARLHLLRRMRLLVQHLRLPHLVNSLQHADLLPHIREIRRKHRNHIAFALHWHEVMQPAQRRKRRLRGVEHYRRLAPTRNFLLHDIRKQAQNENKDTVIVLHLRSSVFQLPTRTHQRLAREFHLSPVRLQLIPVARGKAFMAERTLIDRPLFVLLTGKAVTFWPAQKQCSYSRLFHKDRLLETGCHRPAPETGTGRRSTSL